MERDNDNAKVSRTLTGMDEEHRERDFELIYKMIWKPVKTG